MHNAIGIFDSGYGGLTILDQIRRRLPQYDYLYIGDNARAPYGPRSYEIVYEFTLQAVNRLFDMGCPLVILACNTASAKALRTIQQHDLPRMADTTRRVLGIIRPTVEAIGAITQSRHVGLVATQGTIRSHTYELEIAKTAPDIVVTAEACPMWAPLVENGEALTAGADFFVRRHLANLLQRDPLIDAIILGCTHYPLLMDAIRRHTPPTVAIIPQGEYVAASLEDYLRRHPEMQQRLTQGATATFLTTEQTDNFAPTAQLFLKQPVQAHHISL
ncbi:MAG: glutamate racemase [Bacteroidaceae bacterium]|nr:glutamate racemase [Bacteroidaceae bacterium]